MAKEDNLTPFDSERGRAAGLVGGAAKKGSKHISKWIDELLNDDEFIAEIQENGKVTKFKGAPAKAIVQAHIRLALSGDVKAADMLFKHGYAQKLQLGNDPDNPLTPAIADATVAAEFAEYMKQKTSEQ